MFVSCLYPTTVQVGFEQAVYTVNEGDNVTVCATIMTGRLSRMISVSVDVLPGTASGVGSGKLNCMVYMYLLCECIETLLACSW